MSKNKKSKRGGRRSTTWIKKSNSTTKKVARLGVSLLRRIKKMKPRIRPKSKQISNTRYAGALSDGVYIYKLKKIK